MLSSTIAALLAAWIVALLFSVTLGGFIHLLPLVAAPLLFVRLTRRAKPESIEYQRWMAKRSQARP